MNYSRPTPQEESEIEKIFTGFRDELNGQLVQTETARAHQETLYFYSKGNLAVMDNHRGALWFWAQKIQKDEKYDIFHLDTHLDLEKSKYLGDVTAAQIRGMTLNQYLTYKHSEADDKYTFRWANYIPFFTEQFTQSVGNLYVSVNEEEAPLGINLLNYSCQIYSSKGYDTASVLENLQDKLENPWIINIDVDFFFKYDHYLYSEAYIERLLRLLKTFMQRPGSITTIALSPSCCGSWQNAIGALQYFKKYNLI